jgi:hypothetical protein
MYLRTFLIALALFFGATVPAKASEILARNAVKPTIKINKKGQALISYRSKGRQWHVLAWGAVDARDSTRANLRRGQVKFKLDYSGGWKTFQNKCRPYDGPKLDLVVAACKSPDGSYWVLQEWKRMLPNLGYKPWKSLQKAKELHISHFTGDLAEIEVHSDWVFWGSPVYHHLFGHLTYRGKDVHGFSATRYGNPQDPYGRNVYLDVQNSALGEGWKRENSFLAQRPDGTFCYGFYWHEPYAGYPRGPKRPPAQGDRYRLTVKGPSVTPLVRVVWAGLPDYDGSNSEHVAWEQEKRKRENQLFKGAKHCQQR